MHQKPKPLQLSTDRCCKCKQSVSNKDFKNDENRRTSQALPQKGCSEMSRGNELQKLSDKIAYIEKILTLYQRVNHMESLQQESASRRHEVDQMNEVTLYTNPYCTSRAQNCDRNNTPMTCRCRKNTKFQQTASRECRHFDDSRQRPNADFTVNKSQPPPPIEPSASSEIEIKTVDYTDESEDQPKRKSFIVLFKSKPQTRTINYAVTTQLQPNTEGGASAAKPETRSSDHKSNVDLNSKIFLTPDKNNSKNVLQEPCNCKKTCLSRSDILKRICYPTRCCTPCTWCGHPQYSNSPAEFECYNSCPYVESCERTSRKCNELLTNISDEIELQRIETRNLKKIIKECLVHLVTEDQNLLYQCYNCCKSLGTGDGSKINGFNDNELKAEEKKSSTCICCKCSLANDSIVVENSKVEKANDNKPTEKLRKKRWCGWCSKKPSESLDKTVSRRSIHVQYEKPVQETKEETKPRTIEQIAKEEEGKSEPSSDGDQQNSKSSVKEAESSKTQMTPAISKKSRFSDAAKDTENSKDCKETKNGNKDGRIKKRRCWLIRLCKYCC